MGGVPWVGRGWDAGLGRDRCVRRDATGDGMRWGGYGMVWGWYGMVWDGMGCDGDGMGWDGMEGLDDTLPHPHAPTSQLCSHATCPSSMTRESTHATLLPDSSIWTNAWKPQLMTERKNVMQKSGCSHTTSRKKGLCVTAYSTVGNPTQ